MPSNAEEFLTTLLATLPELPPELARRLRDVVKEEPAERARAIRQLFEDAAGD